MTTIRYKAVLGARKVGAIVAWLEEHVGEEEITWRWAGLEIYVPTEEDAIMLRLTFGI